MPLEINFLECMDDITRVCIIVLLARTYIPVAFTQPSTLHKAQSKYLIMPHLQLLRFT